MGQIAHAKLGASNAHRWMACPGSVAAEDGLPDKTSPFALEGTEAHDLAEKALLSDDANDVLDKHPNSEMAEFVRVYTDYVLAHSTPIAADAMEIEQRVDYSDWVPGGFGTADAVIVNGKTLHVVDLKYGMGVRVDAEENPQGMLYALGAYAIWSMFQHIDRVLITIVQPRLDHISEWEITVPALLRWAELAKQRAELTAEPDAPREPGEKQCRFCKAKASCQALMRHTEATLLSDFDDLDNMPKANTLTEQQMRVALDAKPLIEGWLGAIEKLAKDRLEDGDGFPGYKLVEGRSNRKWSDEREAEAALTELLGDKAFSKPKIVSPAQAEKALGKTRAAEIGELIIKPHGAPTLAPESDKRPAIGVSLEDFGDVTE